ncbi:MAG TPA: hypothetical protein VNG12_19255 [Acidimicrobiales bacterium]|nr:hypothetical protein [Acidimicrobiales bacterium]
MPSPTRHRILPVRQLNAEWETLGRSRRSVQVLQELAGRDRSLARLVDPSGAGPVCRTPWDLVDHMHHATGRRGREEAAALVRVLLREATLDPLVGRFILQALVPGMMTVANRLRWGHGGDWEGGDDFFAELLSTAWVVVRDWSGQDRPYAAGDLLSAIRCRMRRTLFRAKDLQLQHVQITPAVSETLTARSETDLERLARELIELRREGMRSDEVEVLYAHHVLGYSIAELAVFTGRERRALYSRRDRGHRRLCA